MEIRVECQEGGEGRCEPVAFYLGERRVEVVAIVDRWFGSHDRYLKCRGSDDARYILRYDEREDRWEMTMFDRREES